MSTIGCFKIKDLQTFQTLKLEKCQIVNSSLLVLVLKILEEGIVTLPLLRNWNDNHSISFVKFYNILFPVPRHAVGGLLDNQYPIHCGGSNVGWDDAAGYEQGCYKFGESTAFQVFK